MKADKKPFIYLFIYYKIKEKVRTNSVTPGMLKEHIGRVLVRSNGGFPKFLVRDIIEDMIKFDLVKRVNCREYELIDNEEYKKIKQKMLMF